jgi:hypothetical protein
MNDHKQGTTTEVAKPYTLSRIGEPDGEFKPLYIATVRGVQFAVGYFATVEDAKAAADANLADYLTRLDPKPVYRVKKIGTVTVDTGAVVILDPCRIGSVAATQDHDDLIGSPLYPESSIEPGQRVDDVTLSRQIFDPPVPAKENPKEIKDFGTHGGNAISLETGLGDGEYSVIAEIVNCGPLLGDRIAAIHIQFMASEDIDAAKRQTIDEAKKSRREKVSNKYKETQAG